MIIGFCKFCGEEKEIINSHIIPKCFYQLKTSGRVSRVDVKGQKIDFTRYQNGHKEPLLCADCDNQLGKLDAYANEILFNIIPTQGFRISDDLFKKCILRTSDFNYYKLRKFFISLVWRTSVCKSHPPTLGVYEKKALRILKHEMPDNNTLFLPLIYRKDTKMPVDLITGVFSDNFLGQHNYRFRFPNYEILVITDTENTNNNSLINILKPMFTRSEIIIIELSVKSFLDHKLITEMVKIQEIFKKIRPSYE